MTQAGFDRDEAQVWLEQLHGDSEGFLHICSVGNFAGATIDLSKTDWVSKALYYIESLHNGGTEGIYLRATTISRRLDKGERGGVKDTLTFPGFWADIDLRGPGHKHEVCTDDCVKPHRHKTLDLPETVEQAKTILAGSGLPEPTLWIHSGGGLYPWWLLKDPLRVTEDGLLGLQALSEQWHRIIGHTFERAGFEYGTGIHDLARVLRIPGTVNRKAGMERPCTFLPQNSGTMYTMADLSESATSAAKEIIPEPAPRPAPRETIPGSGVSPLDDFEVKTDWADILIPLGWAFSHQQGPTRYWVRPGKDRRDGHSATTGHAADRDRIWVFSTDVLELEAQKEHTKQYVYAAYHHAGDMSAAAKSLREKGFGEARTVMMDVEPTVLAPFTVSEKQAMGWRDESLVAEPVVPQQIAVPDLSMYEHSDSGNAERMVAMYPTGFRYCADMKKWAIWEGSVWRFALNSDPVKAAVKRMNKIAKKQAGLMGEEGTAFSKWASTSNANSKVEGAVAMYRTEPGVEAHARDFDTDPKYLNVRNGILNLESGELLAHDPRYMLSKTFGATYRPTATAPRWLQFLEEVIPDAETRDFLQRMAGYSLLGKPNRRAMALLSGPPGTGKSKLVETLTQVFGDYGGTAAASLFRAKKGDNTSTVELHALRGKRFVATSESAEDSKLDEELIKRLTGQDSITSRGLYEAPQSWTPQAVMWMATNHNPKINPDDPAAWGRIKVIEFNQKFEGSETEDHDILDKLLAEADGILNWLLEGLAKFRSQGVTAPRAVTDAGEKYRVENDTALQFLVTAFAQEQIVPTPEAEVMKAHLFQRYENWCQANRFLALRQRKFNKRVASTGIAETKRGGQVYWVGIA
ncbi:MAG: hypothetical protein EHM35_06175, partial [Planctomycetaceae bacterium]